MRMNPVHFRTLDLNLLQLLDVLIDERSVTRAAIVEPEVR